jgi:hypothetical protein
MPSIGMSASHDYMLLNSPGGFFLSPLKAHMSAVKTEPPQLLLGKVRVPVLSNRFKLTT